MGSFEDVFVEKLGKALIDCAEARQAVPLDWGTEIQNQCRRDIAAAMGILQPPGTSIGTRWDGQAYSWSAVVFDIAVGKPVDYERRIRDLAVRITGYAMVGRSAVEHLQRLLDTYDAQRYKSRIPDHAKTQLSAAEKCFQSVIDGLGDEGVYPWL
jgi:hypothetical protein